MGRSNSNFFHRSESKERSHITFRMSPDVHMAKILLNLNFLKSRSTVKYIHPASMGPNLLRMNNATNSDRLQHTPPMVMLLQSNFVFSPCLRQAKSKELRMWIIKCQSNVYFNVRPHFVHWLIYTLYFKTLAFFKW